MGEHQMFEKLVLLHFLIDQLSRLRQIFLNFLKHSREYCLRDSFFCDKSQDCRLDREK